MLTKNDVKIIKNIVNEVVGGAISRAVAPLVTKEEAKNFATKDDLKGLATSVANIDTKLTRFEVNMARQFTDLKAKTTKDTVRLEKAIKRERKLSNTDFGHLENEDRKISIRVDKIEHRLGFAPAA